MIYQCFIWTPSILSMLSIEYWLVTIVVIHIFTGCPTNVWTPLWSFHRLCLRNVKLHKVKSARTSGIFETHILTIAWIFSVFIGFCVLYCLQCVDLLSVFVWFLVFCIVLYLFHCFVLFEVFCIGFVLLVVFLYCLQCFVLLAVFCVGCWVGCQSSWAVLMILHHSAISGCGREKQTYIIFHVHPFFAYTPLCQVLHLTSSLWKYTSSFGHCPNRIQLPFCCLFGHFVALQFHQWYYVTI